MSLIDCECEDDCTKGFIPQDALDDIVRQESEWLYSSDEISIIPGLNFTRPGRVSSWKFAARHVVGPERSAMPQIQIWRPVIRTRQPIANIYEFISSTSMSVQDLEEEEDNVFTHQLSSEVGVEAGDVVGIEQPENSQLLVVFQHSDLVINYLIDPDRNEFDVESTADNNTEMRLPLVRPEFLPLSGPTTPSATPPLPPPPPPPPPSLPPPRQPR